MFFFNRIKEVLLLAILLLFMYIPLLDDGTLIPWCSTDYGSTNSLAENSDYYRQFKDTTMNLVVINHFPNVIMNIINVTLG